VPEPRAPSDRIVGLIPFAPWILYGLASGFNHWRVAAGGGLILCLLYLALMLFRGTSIKLMDWTMFTFFVIASVLTVGLRSPAFPAYNLVIIWSCNALAAWSSVGFGRPFTAAYAREKAPPEFWNHPVFIRLNLVMTLVWCGLMTVNVGIVVIGVVIGGLVGRVALGVALPMVLLIFGFVFNSRFPARYLARSGLRDAVVSASSA
jgi:hypothetical protein